MEEMNDPQGNDSHETGPHETDPQETASIRGLSQACKRLFERLWREEESKENDYQEADSHWTSRQYAEFNLWCVKIGANGQGHRSIDIRLKDVPETCEIIVQLLQSLNHELKVLCQPQVQTDQIANLNASDDESDGSSSGESSVSFPSLSSLDETNDNISRYDAAPLEGQYRLLRRHIADTIDRLHDQALQIEKAGSNHRRARIEVYKKRNQFAYKGYQDLAFRRAKDQFPLASDTFQQTMAESFARRRIRFDYLRAHQKKRAIGFIAPAKRAGLQAQPQITGPREIIPAPILDNKSPDTLKIIDSAFHNHLEDRSTVYSATVDTSLEHRPKPREPERAESVASVVTRHVGFPPPPKFTGASFQCPYCRLEFRAAEAQKSRWSHHVMQDFEPYFCFHDGCASPFDVPNTFEGLMRHLQADHVEERFHIDMPNGKHEELGETEFEEYINQQSSITSQRLDILKEASRRKGMYLIQKCPFCGGYPDDVEKGCPDPGTPTAQNKLRQHIKRHMQDIALFLPPEREDLFESGKAGVHGSDFSRKSDHMKDAIQPEDHVMVCGREDCDCTCLNENDTKLPVLDSDATDFWASLFPDSLRYDTCLLSENYCLQDKHLRAFLAAKSNSKVPVAPQLADDSDLTAEDPLMESNTPAFVNQMRLQRDHLDLSCLGTGNWLIKSQDYKRWLNDLKEVLFCTGIPGAGKTLLTSIVIQDILNRPQTGNTVGFAFFYCASQQYSDHPAHDVLLCILKQLIHGLKTVPDNLSFFSSNPDFSKTPPSLQDISNAFSTVISSYSSRILIVIDAIDAFKDRPGPEQILLSALTDIRARGANLFLTARSIPRIQSRFQRHRLINVRAHDDDLRIMLEQRLPFTVLNDPAWKEKIGNWVIRTCDGMFLVAQACLGYLEYHFSRESGSREEQERFFQQDISKYRYVQTAKCDELYDNAISYLVEDDSVLPLARRALSWVALAQRPLRMSELLCILIPNHEEQYQTFDILSACGGLLVFDSATTYVGPAHYTLQDYLVRTVNKWSDKDDVDLAVDCLQYITSSESLGHVCTEVKELKSRFREFPFYQYATGHWGHHARKASEKESDPAFVAFLLNEDFAEASGQALMFSESSRAQATALHFGVTGLHLGAYFGLVVETEELLQANIAIDPRDSRGRTPLAYAVKNGHSDATAVLLKHGANPDIADSDGDLPLYVAIANGREDLVSLLLDSGASAEATDEQFWTPLLSAIQHGHGNIVTLLLDYGVPLDESRDGKWTPLTMAVYYGHTTIAKHLIQRGVDKEAKLNQKWRRWTPLLIATTRNDQATVELLVLAGANLEAEDVDGKSSLMLAVERQSEPLVRLLLHHGANIHSATQSGITALLLAAWDGNENIFRALLEAGASIEARDVNGKTALSIAVQRRDEHIVRLLISHGVDYEKTLLHEVEHDGDSRIIEALLEADGAVHLTNAVGKPLLAIAVERGNKALIQVLLSNGADPKATDRKGNTPLLLLIEDFKAVEDTADLLLQHGAEIEATDPDGSSALLLAVRHQDEGLVRLLLLREANIHAENESGATPLSYALDPRNSIDPAIQNLLEERQDELLGRSPNHETKVSRVAKNAEATVQDSGEPRTDLQTAQQVLEADPENDRAMTRQTEDSETASKTGSAEQFCVVTHYDGAGDNTEKQG